MSQVPGRPFQPGNTFGRGRPKGSRNKRSAVAQEILDQHSDPLSRKCVAMALQGDTRAMALCMERILPALRDPWVHLRLPKLKQVKDVALGAKRVLEAIAQGELTPAAGEMISNLIENYRQTFEGQEMEARIAELEKRAQEQERKPRPESIRPKRSTAAPDAPGEQARNGADLAGHSAGDS